MKKKNEVDKAIEDVSEELAEMIVGMLFPKGSVPREPVNAVETVPDTWQERMKREYRETKERYEKLHRMITKYEAGVLEFTPKCSIELLKQQKKHMGEYLHDLEVRGYVEGVEL